MIDNLKSYPAYKDSGVPWLGDVPEHWEVLPHRVLFKEVNDRNNPEEQMLSVTIARGVVRQRTLLEDITKKDSSNLDKSNYKLVTPYDLVYNKMRAWQGAIGVSELRGIVSPAYVVIRLCGGHDPYYFHHLFRTPGFAREAERWSYGITSDMWSLCPEHFKLIQSCCPPLPEQLTITRFLDHADRLIRRYIRAKQKLIKLLEEQKQAIIHQAVTRGLDPNVRLKPSGVEWLGDAPEGWEVTRIKRVCRVQGGYAFPSSAFRDVGIPIVRMNNLKRGQLDLSEATRVPESGAISAFVLTAGDILYGLSGSVGATGSLGNYAVVQEADLPAMLNQRVARFISRQNGLEADFLLLIIQSVFFYEQVLAETTGTAQFNVSTNDIENVAFALPSNREQIDIVQHIKKETRGLNTAIDRANQEITLLHEYRARLIADVVTGKLDVRGWTPPAEVDEPVETDKTEDLDNVAADEISELMENAVEME